MDSGELRGISVTCSGHSLRVARLCLASVLAAANCSEGRPRLVERGTSCPHQAALAEDRGTGHRQPRRRQSGGHSKLRFDSRARAG